MISLIFWELEFHVDKVIRVTRCCFRLILFISSCFVRKLKNNIVLNIFRNSYSLVFIIVNKSTRFNQPVSKKTMISLLIVSFDRRKMFVKNSGKTLIIRNNLFELFLINQVFVLNSHDIRIFVNYNRSLVLRRSVTIIFLSWLFRFWGKALDTTKC